MVKNLPAMQKTQVQFLGQEEPLEKGITTHSSILGASLIAQLVKNLPPMQETPVGFLGWEDLLEKGKSYPLQYSCLENPMNRGAWQATVHGVTRIGTRFSD